MKKKKAVSRSCHVLIGISTGHDQFDKALPAKMPTYMTTVDALPHALVRR